MDNVNFVQTIYEALCMEHMRDLPHEDSALAVMAVLHEARRVPRHKQQELYQKLIDDGFIQTPLQQLIEYNVTNGCGYRPRGKFNACMGGFLSQEPVGESLLMNKQKINDNLRGRK